MNNVLGIINLTQDHSHLNPLTNHRNQASIPFGARYRMIDFILSSMVNSSIRNISVFTSAQNRSLLDHLGIGKDWDLDRKQDGLFIFPYDSIRGNGDLALFASYLDYFEKSSQEDVLIAFGSLIANIDLVPIYKEYVKSGADATIVYKEKTKTENTYPLIDVDDLQNVVHIEKGVSRYESLDLVFMKKKHFIHLVKKYVNHKDSLCDVLTNEHHELKIKGYKYGGYAERIKTIQDYYKANMQLLNPSVIKQLLLEPDEVYTKQKDDPPTKFSNSSKVSNSIIANGCVIEGEVENSILFRGVHVKKGATIKNCIILQKSQIGEHATLDYVVLDKEVNVKANHNLQGTITKPKIIEKGETLGAYSI